MDFIESKTRALDLQARLVAIERLAWRAIQHFKQDAYADQRAAELNIQASKAAMKEKNWPGVAPVSITRYPP